MTGGRTGLRCSVREGGGGVQGRGCDIVEELRAGAGAASQHAWRARQFGPPYCLGCRDG